MMLKSVINHLGNHLDVYQKNQDFRNFDFLNQRCKLEFALENSSFPFVFESWIPLGLSKTRVLVQNSSLECSSEVRCSLSDENSSFHFQNSSFAFSWTWMSFLEITVNF